MCCAIIAKTVLDKEKLEIWIFSTRILFGNVMVKKDKFENKLSFFLEFLTVCYLNVVFDL